MKFCVIGLGRFGYQVATILSENGMEVLAVDSNPHIVESMRDIVAHAIVMKITDEESLRSIGVDEIDTVIVAMGEDTSESILITALLKKHLQIPYVITRAINDINAEILTLVGADKVILPEKEIGNKLADSLSLPFTDFTRLSKHFSVITINALDEWVNKSVKSLESYEHYEAHCIGVKKQNDISPITADYIIQEDDQLLFAGTNKGLEKLLPNK
jgi:trk system potassium uptake protein TrkA